MFYEHEILISEDARSCHFLFPDSSLESGKSVKAGKIDDYVTPTFYAPDVSWLVQRAGWTWK